MAIFLLILLLAENEVMYRRVLKNRQLRVGVIVLVALLDASALVALIAKSRWAEPSLHALVLLLPIVPFVYFVANLVGRGRGNEVR